MVDSKTNPCKRCNGKGTHYGEVQWSDGLGGVDMTCDRCIGTGNEPSVMDLRRQLDDAHAHANNLNHALGALLRAVIWDDKFVDGHTAGEAANALKVVGGNWGGLKDDYRSSYHCGPVILPKNNGWKAHKIKVQRSKAQKARDEKYQREQNEKRRIEREENAKARLARIAEQMRKPV